jgi:hypothetical protein
VKSRMDRVATNQVWSGMDLVSLRVSLRSSRSLDIVRGVSEYEGPKEQFEKIAPSRGSASYCLRFSRGDEDGER